ncbi:FMN-dependent NADH-azoreductase [Nostoc sp.]|uniref:FMN-dependent NADH-azoreductase n=1 Tax=Nostoc sp. TaxID=1180 RepID=UPI002FF8AC2D
MVHILHIDSSPRAERSHSRTLSYEFITAWKTAHPQDTVTYRDLGHHPVPHVDESWIAAAYTPPEARTPELNEVLKTSDSLVDELLAADCYVFAIPMHNFNVPSTFKAYIDQIVRVRRTFTMDGKGLVEGKKMLIITARGFSYQQDSKWATYDFQEPFLRAIFGFIGITDIRFINAEGINLGEDSRTQSLARAGVAIKDILASW